MNSENGQIDSGSEIKIDWIQANHERVKLTNVFTFSCSSLSPDSNVADTNVADANNDDAKSPQLHVSKEGLRS